MNQKTIKVSQTLKGAGLHGGKEVTLTFKPAPEDTGYVFIRKDLPESPEIKADVRYLKSTVRGTNLEKDGVALHTVEHVLAAVVAMEIDNIYIELDAPEPPIRDGSAKDFVTVLEKCEIQEQKKSANEFVVQEVITHKDETGAEIILVPSDRYELVTMIDFQTDILSTQNAVLHNLSDFKEQIAPARTFCLLTDLEPLLEQNLIEGGHLKNAIVYVDKDLAAATKNKLRKIFKIENDIPVNPGSTLQNVSLHWHNEAARHKLLDIIGDLALVGTKIRGKIIANKPGHTLNTAFAKKIQQIIKSKNNNIPKFDLSKPPLMDIHKIMAILPHRPPFLLIDKVLELTEKSVTALKNVTMNEPFFVGHFPGAPVMPGVLQIEAMAQCGGILVLSTVPDPENYLTYFAKIDKVRFKQKVLPGDTLVFRGDLLAPIRRGICHMKTYAYVGEKLVSEAELLAQIVKVKNN